MFYKSFSLGPKDLDRKFRIEFKEILKQKRGGGYWIWKFRIIQNLISQINRNDLVVYCDAGASLNINNSSKKRFSQYVDKIVNSDFGNFRMQCEPQYIEKNYTTKEIFDYFNVNPNSNIGNSPQLQAGHMIFKKNNHTSEFFKLYEDCLKFDKYLITDKYNLHQQKEFVDNRHDQSLFSIISKIHGAEVIKNETEFRDRTEQQYNFPFLSVRRYGHGKKDYLNYFLNKKKFLEKTNYF